MLLAPAIAFSFDAVSLRELLEATQRSVFDGPGHTPSELRRAISRFQPPAELATLVEKIRRHAYRVTDRDLEALGDRYNEDQRFEIVVASAVSAANERFNAAMAALKAATEGEQR